MFYTPLQNVEFQAAIFLWNCKTQNFVDFSVNIDGFLIFKKLTIISGTIFTFAQL